MFMMRFTERPYVAYTEEDVRRSFRSSVRLTFPNSHFDPVLGAELYNEYLDEYELSEVSGFVRGTGIESWATNTNPVHNRERFEEAHDLIIKTWTTPGPFRWEGKHYHFRVVNPFERPLQQPHPPVWIPGVGSPETLEWCARHHYPYIYLETDPDVTVSMTDLYNKAAAEIGYEPGPQNFAYLWRIHVQDTDEKAAETGKGFLIGNAGVGRVPLPGDFMAPAGYNSREGSKRLLEQYKHALRPG